MPRLAPIFWKAYWSLAAMGAVWLGSVLLLVNPTVQRHALYAHKLHSGYIQSINNTDSLGFAANQVTTFNLTTPDHEHLYCWHILPLNTYLEHQEWLVSAPQDLDTDFVLAPSFQLLENDPNSRVVINFHGNAGHLAQGLRPSIYHKIVSMPNTHLITCDYRGFGYSTGVPSEAGLIIDAITLTNFVLKDLSQPAHRLILLGQSLGTAVASATALHFANPDAPELPPNLPAPVQPNTAFAGVILVASFTHLKQLVLSYKIAGAIPILGPLSTYPWLLRWILKSIVDTWNTTSRIDSLLEAGKNIPMEGSGIVKISLLHARDDYDIPYEESKEVYLAAEKSMGTTGVKTTKEEIDWEGDGKPPRRGAFEYRSAVHETMPGVVSRSIELEIVRKGGHNRVVSYTPVALSIMRAFDSSAQTLRA